MKNKTLSDKNYTATSIEDLERFIFSLDEETFKIEKKEMERINFLLKQKQEYGLNQDFQMTVLIVPIKEGKEYN